nr:hypothetical protein BaRGS_019497 [Batillaria attramentaria]
MDSRGEVERKLSKAPLKDTVVIPNGGYTIFRFIANNPGVWFFHCHLAFHAESGMAVALEVLDESGGLPAPPPGFPRCGPFVAPELRTGKAQTGSDTSSKNSNNNNKLTSGNGGPVQKSPADTAQTVVPQWVLPMVLTLSLAVLALSVTSFSLWRKNKKRDAERSRWGTFPRYDSHGENSPDEIMAATSGNDGSDVTHFSYSKKQERVSLTK